MQEEIAATTALEVGDPFALDSCYVTGLRSMGKREHGRSIKRFDRHVSTKGRLGNRNVNFSVEVISLTMEKLVLFNNDLNEQISIGPTTWASRTAISEPHLRPSVNPRWNIERQ